MTAAELLAALSARGVRLEARGDRLRYYPRAAVTPELREEMAARKQELLALLAAPVQAELSRPYEDAIAWRVEAMLPQVPAAGPLPLLLARECIEPAPGACYSCGEGLRPGEAYACGACARAANLAVEIARVQP